MQSTTSPLLSRGTRPLRYVPCIISYTVHQANIRQDVPAAADDELFGVALEDGSEVDKLESYMSMPCHGFPGDSMKYWHALLPTPLACMTLDLLSAPGMC